jgi:glutamate synthase (NADPH/NADH) small chain
MHIPPGSHSGGIEEPMTAQKLTHLIFSEEAARLMADRGILKEDIEQTISHAETTGDKFINPASGRSLAFLRPGRVTYWVEYTPSGTEYFVHTAYSHRMEMKRGPGL